MQQVFFFLTCNPYIFCFTEDCFDETIEAMVHLGINTENQKQIFKVKALLMKDGKL